MYNATSAFRAGVVAGNQLAVVRASVAVGTVTYGDLDIISGAVTLDGRRDGALRSLSLSVAPSDNAWQWLTTYGAEIRVWRGLTLSGGDELVPLGVFVIDADLEQTDGGPISIEAADRSRRISRARWTAPYQISAGVDVGTAIRGILLDRWIACPVGFTVIGQTTSAQQIFTSGSQSDPWKDAKALAASIGHDLYFNGAGVVQMTPIPNPLTATACATYFDGELSIVLSETHRADLSQTYNVVVANGEGTDVTVPVEGIAMDRDPTSPTYIYGALGPVPLFFSSPLLTTQAMVDSAAATRLSKVRGRVEQMSWKLLTNPAHEPGDVIQFSGAGGVARYMIDQLVIPLTAEGMTATARETYRSA